MTLKPTTVKEQTVSSKTLPSVQTDAAVPTELSDDYSEDTISTSGSKTAYEALAWIVLVSCILLT